MVQEILQLKAEIIRLQEREPIIELFKEMNFNIKTQRS